MSFFMTIAGPPIDMRGLEPFELTPVQAAQEYIRKLAAELSNLDGVPLYLVHDGHSGTSHDVVCEAFNAAIRGDPLSGDPLFVLLGKATSERHTIRIWWGGNDDNAHLRVVHCESLEKMIAEIYEQASRTPFIGVRACIGAAG